MSTVRRHLGALSVAWLLCQVALVCLAAAFDITRPSTALADNAKICLEDTPAEQCPMHDATGQPCPMHRGAGLRAASAESHDTHRDQTCALRSTDANPGVLAGLFTLPAVMTDASASWAMSSSALPFARVAVIPVAPISHDTPPPRG